MHSKILLFVGLLLFPFIASANRITGTVSSQNGDPLPFASVNIKGTQNGVLADENGHFTLSATAGNYTLIARYSGYAPIEKVVDLQQSTLTVDLIMSPQTLTLNEVTIKATGEDPAVAIMRKVIERRKYHENLIKTRETDIYLKGSLKTQDLHGVMGQTISQEDLTNLGLDSNGNGILYLLEEVSHYTYKAPGKTYNKVLSVRESGDPHGLGIATMPPILNIYQNNLQIFRLNERGYISPANNNAFHYYDFKYLGSFEQYGRTIDKIQIVPKRKLEPVFSGVVYVAEDDWVFQSVDLYLTKDAQLFGVDTVRLRQDFQPIQKDLWLIENQILSAKLRILGIHLNGTFLTVYQNQRVNEPVDESLFSGRILASYDSLAQKRDSSYWSTTRPIPITDEEKKNFQVKDSIYQHQTNLLNQDSLKKAIHYDFGFLDILNGNPGISNRNNEWRVRPLFSAIQFNSVEGVSGTIDLSWFHRMKADSFNNFSVRWLNRYGFGNKRFNSLFRVGMSFHDPNWRTRSWSWEFTGGKYLFQINDHQPINPFMNELYNLAWGRNYMELYGSKIAALKLNRNWGNGFKAGIQVKYERRMSLENSSDYSFKHRHDPRVTPNLAIDNADAFIVGLNLQYQPGKKYILFPEFKYPIYNNRMPVFRFNYTQGLNPGNVASNFGKWRLSLQHSVRLRMLGRLDYHLITGGFLWKKSVNLPDWNHIDGNRTFLATAYLSSFQLAPYYRFSNTAKIYGEGHAQWHLNGLLTNKIPLFRRLNWYLVGGTNVMYINRDNYYAEASVGLENIGFGLLRFGRIDFITGYESGVDKVRFGVRVGLSGLFQRAMRTTQSSDL